MTTDTLEVSPLILIWKCRLNGDGNSFDAMCDVTHLDDDTIEVSGALTAVEGGIYAVQKLAKGEFKERGYTHYQYRHNGKDVKRRL